jgi:hypothetical protein
MGKKERVMPRDVTTRWNSTYDMLDFALDHKVPLSAMTSEASNKLRTYELSEEEWGYVEELREVLKVSQGRHVAWSRVALRFEPLHHATCHTVNDLNRNSCRPLYLGIQAGHAILLAVQPDTPDRDSSDGLHR